MCSLSKKVWIIIVAAFGIIALSVAAAIEVTTHVAEATNSDVTNWGLSFQEEGKCPIGNATSEELKKYNACFVGDTSQKKIYLTFDAGYENGYTEKILETLKKHNVKAAFFLVGNFLETQPELVKQMIADGHTVGNHTYTHPDMSKLQTEDAFANELTKNETLFKEITGQEMSKFYRPPQGKYCVTNLEMAKKMGYNTVFWSLAYVDWYNDDQPTRDEAFAKLIPRIHNGAVLLLHSTSKTNCEILDELLTEYENMGYEFGEISELFN